MARRHREAPRMRPMTKTRQRIDSEGWVQYRGHPQPNTLVLAPSKARWTQDTKPGTMSLSGVKSAWVLAVICILYVHVYVDVFIYIYIYIYVCVWVYMCVCVCVYIYIYIYIYIYLCVCLCVHIYIYIYVCVCLAMPHYSLYRTSFYPPWQTAQRLPSMLLQDPPWLPLPSLLLLLFLIRTVFPFFTMFFIVFFYVHVIPVDYILAFTNRFW